MDQYKEKILNVLPAIRMIMSDQTTKVAIFVPLSQLQVTDPAELSARIGRSVSVFKNRSSDEIIQEVIKMRKDIGEYLFIEEMGLIGIGVNKSKIEQKLIVIRKSRGDRELPESVPVPQIKKTIYNKIVMITGGAQGFGEGIARNLFKLGANIIIGDINEEGGMALVKDLNAHKTPNRALFVKMDVTDPASVDAAVTEVIFEYGGMDLMISNAGILRAGSLEEMDPDEFMMVTRVNYTGFFHCTRSASRVMKVQNRYGTDHYSDIIQINSKSGLQGSKKNFAYAGGKFGGIGLVQSFALELIPDRIKVNAICPGNYFEGPLWSDPDNGLFVQYLKAGKVPGAKTIADVKKHYESMVPAGRGCKPADVVKAILYVIDQEYETGQAIPVTGGQVMLR
ncbi:MAG: SDR family NAD(P)-dependent oxidoreductase [Bacteroidales bacterium]|nr:SDR family NAD(P)-dependent oxidoreductase [Bacteroidales bacterium]MBN2697256.1 SDR family NAD(P)-dependent oxidoreductase [Bacteroidales bacterium]